MAPVLGLSGQDTREHVPKGRQSCMAWTSSQRDGVAIVTYREFAASASSAQVRYHNNYVTRLIAERQRSDGKLERMLIACPACQSTDVTRLNFNRAQLYGEPLHDQCDRCRHLFLEDESLVILPNAP